MEPAEYQPFPPEVHDYVDGRLSAEAERDFERRMNASTQLRGQVEQLRQTLDMLHSLPPREPSPGFAERVIRCIREEELAERARQRIAAAPSPLWKPLVQIGVGAVAASLILALVGIPLDRPLEFAANGGEEVAAVAPTEGDLLPALADHCQRLEFLRRNLDCCNLRDADMQRQLVRTEVETSDLARRCAWLGREVGRLPIEQRIEYAQFIEGLARAMESIEAEVTESNRDHRPVALALIRAQLAEVRVPATLQGGYEIRSRVMPPTASPISRSEASQLSLFREIRYAEYHHNPHGVIAAADAYAVAFPQGTLAWQAAAARVSALLKLGRDLEAASCYDNAFSRYDSDQSPELRALLKAHFKPDEAQRLAAVFRTNPD